MYLNIVFKISLYSFCFFEIYFFCFSFGLFILEAFPKCMWSWLSIYI